MSTIANPIYDANFKFLMQDEACAIRLLSAVLDREITLLEFLPQEHALVSRKSNELSVIRFDFRATIREEDGTVKKVLIELQKARHLVDLARFRQYLASNYMTPDRVEQAEVHLPIITIYLLGFQLSLPCPVIQVGGVYTDALTKQPIEGMDAFIEALTHNAYFIQIPRLPDKYQTRLERILLLFSQRWIMDPAVERVLQVPEEFITPDNDILARRLILAMMDLPTQQKAFEEDSFDQMLTNEINAEGLRQREEGKAEGKAEGIEEGLAKGIEKGILETERKLKAIGISIEQIAQATGLSPTEIAGL